VPVPLSAVLNRADGAAELSPSGPYRGLKQLGLVLLCATWIVLGLFGHDPWKADDATAFGVAYDMLKQGDWVVPHLAGAPVPEHPPLLYAFAAATAWALRGVLPLHDGAHVAVGLCIGATLWLLGLAGRELYGRAFGWLPVLIFVGCVGLWDRGHLLSPEIALLLADALALYALALGLRRPVAGGAWLGLAIGMAFLGRGTVAAAIIALTAAVLPLFAAWRTRRHALSIAVAVGVALPLLVSWPLALYLRSPALFAQWAGAQSLSAYFGWGANAPPLEPFYYLKNLLWLAWPALPLALWTLWVRGRGYNGSLATPGVQLPGTLFLILLVVLSAAPEPRASLALPLLVPLAPLGAAEVDSLKRGHSGALDWFGILTFGLLAVLVWGLWFWTWRNGLSEPVASLFRDAEPGYRPRWQWLPMLVSLFLTLLWLALVRPARRSNRRAVLNWAAGMVLVWGLFATIWLPYVDSRRSYRPVAEALAALLPAGTCLASHNVGDPQRALLEYFADIITVRDDAPGADRCAMLLVQVAHGEPGEAPDSAWDKIWEGHRRGDDTERFILFRRSPAALPKPKP
jgi:4-amino-4-deoxy-L-arabinose transferase-like glycosyltransferase